MEYTLVRSKNRRRSAALSVRATGEVVVNAPWYMPKYMIDRFVQEHASWISKRQIEIYKPVAPRIKQFASELALQHFIEKKLLEYQPKMELTASGIIYKHVNTYWGSCSPTGKISFNMEMIYAPKEAVEYVVVHELAHLRHRGHGVRFWTMVNKFFPETNEMRKVLRQIGHDGRIPR
jgi:predicted metal-dependent hydrolase